MRIANEAYQVADDLSLVRGRHQMSFGGNMSYWTFDARTTRAPPATSTSTARRPASALADFLTGQASLVRHGAPGMLHMNQWYIGVYAQDTWRATDRVTLNVGLRWEPYFGQNIDNGAISNFVARELPAGSQDDSGSRMRRPGSSIPAILASPTARRA